LYVLLAFQLTSNSLREIRTDSNLLIRSITEWLPGWKRNGWKTSKGEDVKNRDLLEQIDLLCQAINVTFTHVAGHSGIMGNERADELARQGASMH
jgi:ribonuclease HI